ncbi:MAG: hypothetical protein IJA70_03485 [Oscillospiraceae bacterium]|nr:hypothetical protein [Oscillospiraceae bacterium]
MKKLVAMLLAMIMMFSFAACGGETPVEEPKEIVVDTSYFDDLNVYKDDFEGTKCYYPDGEDGYEVEMLPYEVLESEGFVPRFTFFYSEFRMMIYYYDDSYDFFVIYPNIFYEPEDNAYRFECVARGPHLDKMDSLVIITDNHKYTVSEINYDTSYGIFSLGQKGFDMIKDIHSCKTVKIRIIDIFGKTQDCVVSSSQFDLVYETLEKFEKAGCAQYDFAEYDANITVD